MNDPEKSVNSELPENKGENPEKKENPDIKEKKPEENQEKIGKKGKISEEDLEQQRKKRGRPRKIEEKPPEEEKKPEIDPEVMRKVLEIQFDIFINGLFRRMEVDELEEKEMKALVDVWLPILPGLVSNPYVVAGFTTIGILVPRYMQYRERKNKNE